MVEAAEYIYKKLKSENLLERAFNWRREAGTDKFDLVCVGHSLGGGTATILALMLRQEYPNIKCFAYSPPGGLLSYKAMEASKELVTSVVVGKDLVPRIGLHQLESLRHDLIAALKKSQHPKWRTLSSSMLCCWDDATSVESPSSPSVAINIHPLDSSINLSCHQPLYPPGRIIHIVRHHPNNEFGKPEPVYQAVWADNLDFDQVLISKCMIQDHMPDNVLEALEKVLGTDSGPVIPELSGSSSLEPQQPVVDSQPVAVTAVSLETSFSPREPRPEKAKAAVKESSYVKFDDASINSGSLFPWDGREELTQRFESSSDHWVASAPIASPETLSDASSICSSSFYMRDQVTARMGSLLTNITWMDKSSLDSQDINTQIRFSTSPQSERSQSEISSRQVKFNFSEQVDSNPNKRQSILKKCANSVTRNSPIQSPNICVKNSLECQSHVNAASPFATKSNLFNDSVKRDSMSLPLSNCERINLVSHSSPSHEASTGPLPHLVSPTSPSHLPSHGSTPHSSPPLLVSPTSPPFLASLKSPPHLVSPGSPPSLTTLGSPPHFVSRNFNSPPLLVSPGSSPIDSHSIHVSVHSKSSVSTIHRKERIETQTKITHTHEDHQEASSRGSPVSSQQETLSSRSSIHEETLSSRSSIQKETLLQKSPLRQEILLQKSGIQQETLIDRSPVFSHQETLSSRSSIFPFGHDLSPRRLVTGRNVSSNRNEKLMNCGNGEKAGNDANIAHFQSEPLCLTKLPDIGSFYEITPAGSTEV